MLTRIAAASARRVPRVSAVSTRFYSENQFKCVRLRMIVRTER